ncbi:hypothetical protein F2P81_003871 [Scophthalmus maximus]|uniref:Protein phosphatase 1 regulatory subunit 37 n=1 Tax=Scophthalmus maximus TaxID=52904 RepID=A0A6A4TFC7_SCOMX|nr:hypothetical protein F2P81_003871 [Scophthalmus maximus]
MTHCSDNEKDEQSDDDGAQRLQENLKKTSKGGKHVSFPPDGQIVSGFAEHKNADRKGERLDHRSCEALEVVLKSLHFDFINLQAAQLEENSVCLSRLDVCNVPMVDYPALALSKALLTSRLTVLHLHNAQLSGMPLYTLVGALKVNRALRELHLTNNLLNSYQDALQLGDLLRYNTTLRTLELSRNAVADAGLEELCDGLRRQTAGLKLLLLRNNQITAKGMVHLAKTLPLLKVLQVLDLAENVLGDEGVQDLRTPLMVNCSLLQLGLAQTNITCEGAVALAEVLAENCHIQRLDLSQNPVRVGGLMALSLALRINCSLDSLDLDQVPPEEQDQFLMETQTRLRSEIRQSCLANARRLSRLPTDPSEADGAR